MTTTSDGSGFWDRLETVLNARGWEPKDLSFHLARAGVLITPDTIRSWKDMADAPRAQTVIAVADLLGVDPRDLLGMDKAEATVVEVDRLRKAAAAEERGDVPAENG